jgi:hypothetical protein
MNAVRRCNTYRNVYTYVIMCTRVLLRVCRKTISIQAPHGNLGVLWHRAESRERKNRKREKIYKKLISNFSCARTASRMLVHNTYTTGVAVCF